MATTCKKLPRIIHLEENWEINSQKGKTQMLKKVDDNVVLKKRGLMIWTAAVVVWVSASTAHASLINGSFEDPDIATGTADLNVYFSDAVPGWTTSPAAASFVRLMDGQPLNSQLGPQDGDQWTYMEAGQGVEQTVSGLIVGNMYTLNGFYGHPARYTGNGIRVEVDGGIGEILPLTAPAAPGAWEPFSATFTATAVSQTIGIFVGAGLETGIDNISLVAVPEPATSVLLGLGALLFPLVIRRAKGNSSFCVKPS